MKRVISLLLALALVLCACGKKNEDTAAWQEQYDLGVRYLTEGKYEEAILAFTAAIEIDPKLVDAYVALADAYLNAGQYEKAVEVMEQGRSACGDTEAFDRVAGSLDFLSSGGTGIRITEFYFDKAAYQAGQATEFLVSVAYRCPEGVDCILMIGANTHEPTSYRMMDEDFAVSGSSGYQFKVNVTPVQWENALFGIYVNLSEAGHAESWTPFASDTMYIDAEGNLSREMNREPGGSYEEDIAEEDLHMLMHDMLQQEGALTYSDLPELFTTPYNQLGDLLERKYVEGSESTSEMTGKYSILVNGEIQSVDYTIPVQNCAYQGENHSDVWVSAPVGDSRCLDFGVDTYGSAGWRGIQMGDSYTVVLEKLGFDPEKFGFDPEKLKNYYEVTIAICTRREINDVWFMSETSREDPLRYLNVVFYNKNDTRAEADYNIYFTFNDGEHLSAVLYSNFALLTELTS